MNFTSFLMNLAMLYMPRFYFDSNELYYPSLMEDFFLGFGQLYYKKELISFDIKNLDELLDTPIVENGQFVYPNMENTDNHTQFKLYANPIYLNGFQNVKNPIHVEIIDTEENILLLYTTLYLFNGELTCGFMIPCGFHNGDIEHIIVSLNKRTFEPNKIFYSSHHDGFWFPWKLINKVDITHPVVYVAHKSHANYPKKGLFMRYYGLINDKTDGLVEFIPNEIRWLHINGTIISNEYKYNGFLGEIPSFYLRKDKYTEQSKLPVTLNFEEMISNMFYNLFDIVYIFTI